LQCVIEQYELSPLFFTEHFCIVSSQNSIIYKLHQIQRTYRWIHKMIICGKSVEIVLPIVWIYLICTVLNRKILPSIIYYATGLLLITRIYLQKDLYWQRRGWCYKTNDMRKNRSLNIKSNNNSSKRIILNHFQPNNILMALAVFVMDSMIYFSPIMGHWDVVFPSPVFIFL
jgi:hypothetical protein